MKKIKSSVLEVEEKAFAEINEKVYFMVKNNAVKDVILNSNSGIDASRIIVNSNL